jgi:hypothetical protein
LPLHYPYSHSAWYPYWRFYTIDGIWGFCNLPLQISLIIYSGSFLCYN